MSPPPGPQEQLGHPRATEVTPTSPSPGVTNEQNMAQPLSSPISGVTTLEPAGPPAPQRLITVETDKYVAQITSRGGRIKSFRLKHYQETASPDSGWYELVPQTGEYVLPLGAILARGDQMLTDSALDYSISAPEDIRIAADEGTTLVLKAQAADGTTIEKTLTFHGDSYAFTTDLKVSGGPKNDAIGLALSQPLNPHAGYYDIPELQAYVTGKAIT